MTPNTEQQLLRSLDELKANVRTIAVKLFGEEQGENSEGRIPRLERRVSNHDVRLGKLEKTAVLVTLVGSLGMMVIEYIIHNGMPHFR